jgi:hypothetical protein
MKSISLELIYSKSFLRFYFRVQTIYCSLILFLQCDHWNNASEKPLLTFLQIETQILYWVINDYFRMCIHINQYFLIQESYIFQWIFYLLVARDYWKRTEKKKETNLWNLNFLIIIGIPENDKQKLQNISKFVLSFYR